MLQNNYTQIHRTEAVFKSNVYLQNSNFLCMCAHRTVTYAMCDNFDFLLYYAYWLCFNNFSL